MIQVKSLAENMTSLDASVVAETMPTQLLDRVTPYGYAAERIDWGDHNRPNQAIETLWRATKAACAAQKRLSQ